MSIGTKIREIRKQKGLTQKKLGEKCNIAESTIRRYELGDLNPKIETLQKIADALEVPLEAIRPPLDEYKILRKWNILEEISQITNDISEVKNLPNFMALLKEMPSQHEALVIEHYRKAEKPIQKAVDKLLDVPDEE